MTILLAISIFLFCVGLVLCITRKNAIMILMGIELMLNAANMNFVVFSKGDADPLEGQIMALFVMVLAAAEAAIGLAIIVQMYGRFKTTELDKVNQLSEG